MSVDVRVDVSVDVRVDVSIDVNRDVSVKDEEFSRGVRRGRFDQPQAPRVFLVEMFGL